MLKVLGARDDVNLEEDSRGSSYCFVVVTSQSNNYLHSLKWLNILKTFSQRRSTSLLQMHNIAATSSVGAIFRTFFPFQEEEGMHQQGIVEKVTL